MLNPNRAVSIMSTKEKTTLSVSACKHSMVEWIEELKDVMLETRR